MRQNRMLFITSLVILLLTITIAAVAGAGTPGSEDDPVVTKSYVDQQIAELSAGGSNATSDAFKVIEVQAGKKILGKEGTEMILRGGSATVIDNGIDGISDVTSGVDLKQDVSVPRNHHLLVPKADGRGIHTKELCWVMIKGGYTVE